MTDPNYQLPQGIRENEPFDGKLLSWYNEEFQCGRTYLLGPVIENSGGIRPLVIFPSEPDEQVNFEDTHYYCTFVSRDFSHLPVGVGYLLKDPPRDWVTEKLKKDARIANNKLLKDQYKYLELLQNREVTKVVNQLPLIFRELEAYLSEREIPFRAYDRFGMIRFSAALDCSPIVYNFQINVFDCGFRVDVSVPVKLPKTEKAVVRLHKFCAQVNLIDPNGCFLVLNPQEEKLLCRQKVTCYGEIPWAVERELPMAAKRMDRCLPLVETLIQGKISVEEAIKKLNRNPDMMNRTSLTVPQARKEYSRNHASCEKYLDAYIRRLEVCNKIPDFGERNRR